WCSVNERDGLGDDLVPDFVTRVREGAFYGWPWFYIGGNQDPRHAAEEAALRNRVSVPDVLLQPHSASMDMTFYDGGQFSLGISRRHFRGQQPWSAIRTSSGYLCSC